MPRIAWRVNRRTGRQRPFRPGLGGCLLWFLILVAVLLVLALFFGGFRKGTQTSGLARSLAAPQMTAAAHVTGVAAIIRPPA
jgi:hypothetical protein